MKKRILTLALALAAVAALAITAMAEAPTMPTGGWTGIAEGKEDCTHEGATYVETAATCTAAQKFDWTCATCGGTVTQSVGNALGHDYTGITWTTTAEQHTGTCTRDGCGHVETADHTLGDWQKDDTNHWKVCSVCSAEVNKDAHTAASYAAGTTTGTHKVICTCGHTTDNVEHTYTEAKYDNNKHWLECVCGTKKADSEAAHVWTIANGHESESDSVHVFTCSGCTKVKTESHNYNWTTKDENGHAGTCRTTGCTHVPTPTHTFGMDGKCTLCQYTNAAAAADGTIATANVEVNAGSSKTLSFSISDANGNVTTSRAGVTFTSSNTAIATVTNAGVVTGRSSGTVTISLLVNGVVKSTATITVKNTANPTVTIPESVGLYYFADSASTTSGYSIYDQLMAAIPAQQGATMANYTVVLGSVPSTSVAVGTLGGYTLGSVPLANVGNLYLNITGTGTWTVPYTVMLTVSGSSREVLSGNISIIVEPYSGIDILYTATLGQSVNLSLADFQQFWSEHTTNFGTLSTVRINSVVGLNGSLCYNHKTTETRHTLADGLTFYASPTTSNQKSLSALTFVPSKIGNKYNSGSVTINFTATGTTRYNNTASTSATGTIVITYTDGEVQSINYDGTSGYIYLNSADFVSVYKAATGSTVKNPSFTIKFLEVPAYGTLYRQNGTGINFIATSALKLTKENISANAFYSSATSTSSIDKVVYVPGTYSTVDSVRYGVYNGSTLLYVGTVTFNAEEINISYTSTSTGVTFSSADFFNVNSSLYSTRYISFGAPSSGTLYKNYSNGRGTAVTVNDIFSYTVANGVYSLDSVTYVPKANFTGIVEIPFYASTLSNAQISGTVKIYVVAKPFSDVTPNGWAAPYINRLYASGVVSGTSTTEHTFSPNANMKYGEALKMILLAAGYPKQSETGGKHWASNYLNLAYRYGIVSSTNIDLNSLVDRNTIAEIAAKALGLSKATRVNAGIIGPSDSTNGYVLALYNAGIVGGEFEGNTNYFRGTRNITRAEVSKIICTIMDYDDKE